MCHHKQKTTDNYWKIVVFTFFLGWVVVWIYRSMLTPCYTEIQRTVGPHSNFDMGFITSCYYFGNTALQIPSGLLVDRFGQKRVLIPGFILFALGTSFLAFAHTLGIIYLGATLAGIGCGAYYGASFSITAQYVPPEKKSICTAIVNSGSAFGMIFGMAGSSILVKSFNIPWQIMAVITTICTFLLIGWIIFAIKNPADDTRKKRLSLRHSSDKSEEFVTLSGEPASRLSSITMVSCYILYFATCYSYYLIVTWLPGLLESERGIKGPATGLITCLIAVTAVPGSICFARLSDKKHDKKPQIIIGLEVCSLILVVLSMLIKNAAALSIVLLVYGFLGKMSVDPVLISYISDHSDHRKVATALGVFNFFGISSSIVAPVLTGLVMDNTGKGELGFYFGGLLLIIGTVLFGSVNIKKQIALKR